MQIQILSIQTVQKTSTKGQPYEVLDIAFKNLTYGGKVEGKQLMPFGGNAPGYAVLKNAQSGQTYEITVVKNAQGFNDWTNAVLSDGAAPVQQPSAPQRTAPVGASAGSNSRGFATPEERAATQVYIVRQSSLTAAINTIGVGSKSALDPAKVIETAKIYEAYVFGQEAKAAPAPDGFSDMMDDIPL